MSVPVSVPSFPGGPLPVLRAATRSHHERIDRLIDVRRLAEPARYARVLQVFAGFLPSWEAAVAAALPAPRRAWLARRSRTGFVARDLLALGLRQPAPVSLPPFCSPEAAWGSLYVLEGAALGGQVITRALASRGLLPHNGAAYFHGWGASTAPMWREFRDLLDTELRHADALAPACEAACRTFDTLSGLLEQALHERPALA